MIVYLLLGALIGDIEYTLVIVFASILLSLPIGAVFLTYPLVSLDLPIDSIYPLILYTFSIKLLPIIILVFIPLCLLSSMIGVMIHDRLLRE
jgi:ABC-type amino acid transport system permease subunit